MKNKGVSGGGGVTGGQQKTRQEAERDEVDKAHLTTNYDDISNGRKHTNGDLNKNITTDANAQLNNDKGCNVSNHTEEIALSLNGGEGWHRGGKIILLNSYAGMQGISHSSTYCASRFALDGLIRSVASETLASKIR